MPGKGKLTLTGQLGDVMKESVAGGHDVPAGAPPSSSGLPIRLLREASTSTCTCPAGGFPKDGPSAGITMVVALASLLTKHPGAHRRGDDGRDHAARQRAARRRHQGEGPRGPSREEVPEVIRKGLTFHYVNKVDEILAFALDLESGPSGRSSERPAAPPPS
jgi:ATP-dependent Lon protease